MTEVDDKSVCLDLGLKWQVCVTEHISEPQQIEKHCNSHADAFEACVENWRNEGLINKMKKIKGDNVGDPPPQCAPLSCTIGECLRVNNYKFEECTVPSSYFKRCVKAMYGSEYIME
eukprot:Tbor_TRINITY_DN1394_c0_g1::TRINITY_DN1394_c0_g1_i1::g.12498::m.12498